jgi:pyrroline-5-carboxylate reductase
MPLENTSSTPIALTLVGCGKMGYAMLQGWRALDNIHVFNIIEPFQSDELKSLAKEEKRICLYSSLDEYKSNIDSAYQPKANLNICILAVKPQMMTDVLRNIEGADKHLNAVISIAAGVPLALFEQYFSDNVDIIRVMPNTPAAIGKGASVYCTQDKCPAEITLVTESLLKPLGKVYRVIDENDMHAVTAISGSGPAYVFALSESLTKAAMELGIAEDIAQDLARQTIIGASSLMEIESDLSAAQLRKAVTSPGGTTQAALEILQGQDEKLDTLMIEATQNACKRSQELSETS